MRSPSPDPCARQRARESLENVDRTGYHDTTDVVSRIDPAYAAQTAAIAITTATSAAQVRAER
jgi:hypothetical protein